MVTFNELELEASVSRAVNSMGFEEATPIQQQTIPAALAGKDLIGQAQTGTGKTAAFGIPLVQKLEAESQDVQALVLTPTRELAVQVAEELNRIGQFKRIRALPIYGGQDITRQINALKKRPAVIVATPGRLMDHIRRRTIRLQSIKMLIVDEGDEMLNMGFIDDIETILKETPPERQTLLFSATMPLPIQSLAKKYMRQPELFSVKTKEMTVSTIAQQYIEVPEKQKFEALCRLLDIHSPKTAIVFGRTKRRVDELAEALNKRGYAAEGIHGDLNQGRRNVVLRQFKEGAIEVMVATDVAARGLDINDVTHVYNFDLPQDPEGYVHRVGRTGRAGKEGLAISFVTPREMDHLRSIESMVKRKMERKPIPSMAEAMEGQQRIAVDQLMEVVQDGSFKKHKVTAEELVTEYNSVTLVAAALKILTKEADYEQVKLTAEPPMRGKHEKRGQNRGNKFKGNDNYNKGKNFQKGNKRKYRSKP